jgi:serine/threonine-protein kinase
MKPVDRKASSDDLLLSAELLFKFAIGISAASHLSAAEQFSDRFSREAHAIASLNHPNITTLYDVGPDYLVMELVEGATLADRIAEGRLTLDEAAHIGRQIADALDFAHERGIVHRDLKPSNIKIRPDGVVKVLDFGLAKTGTARVTPQSDELPTVSAHQTAQGVVVGTFAYMSPEQLTGKNVDRRADVWAFGCVFYEMLTGVHPYGEGSSLQGTMASVRSRVRSRDRRVSVSMRPARCEIAT